MKWLKKVADTPLTSIAKVIDSLDDSTNSRTNAPSIRAVNEAVKDNWINIYPIGSIYMNINDVDPAALFGGIWQQVEDRFILAAGVAFPNGMIGGNATHTLSVEQLPPHTHVVQGGTVTTGDTIPMNPQTTKVTPSESGISVVYDFAAGATGFDIEGEALETGGGVPFNIIPPFLAVNVWIRTA